MGEAVPGAAETVRMLLLSREYPAALAAARAAGPLPSGERHRLERMALARMGRFAEAAAAGEEVVATGAAEPEDRFRLAEILLKLARTGAALDHGLCALTARPDEARFVVPVVEAVLRDPRLAERLAVGLAALGGNGARPLRRAGTGVNLPVDLPYYRPYEGPHPWVMGLVEAAPELAFCRTLPEIADLAAAIRTHLPRALELTDRLCRVHPLVGRGDAAAYVASRFPSCLYGVDGAAVDLLPFVPMSLGERPFVMVFDVIGNLFSPPQPFEDSEADSRATPSYWILRAALEAPACAAIVTNYREAAPLLGGFFGSERIERKSVFVNPICPVAESGEVQRRAAAPSGAAVTLLFTASANWRDEGFYGRGGVDVLNAFLDLAEQHSALRLILRSGIPMNLSPRLRRAVTNHPRIFWRPGFLPLAEFRSLLIEADLFVMPSVGVYRNGLVQAMSWGIVPVVSDAMHAHELVADGETGLVVTGRGCRASVCAADQRYVGDWSDVLRATDCPADRMFYERFVGALAGLIAAPERIASFRERLLANPGTHCHGEADRRRFVATLQAAIESAGGIDLSAEAVFPAQPLHRPRRIAFD
jgi:glycosyltransferase involved in cell wall biosynthesis